MAVRGGTRRGHGLAGGRRRAATEAGEGTSGRCRPRLGVATSARRDGARGAQARRGRSGRGSVGACSCIRGQGREEARGLTGVDGERGRRGLLSAGGEEVEDARSGEEGSRWRPTRGRAWRRRRSD